MKIKLPIVKKNYNEETKKIEVTESTLEVKVNNTFEAHLKYEELFQKDSNISLTDKVAEVSNYIKAPAKASTKMTELLKVMFCFIETHELPSFNEFIGILEPENTPDLIQKIQDVLDATQQTASKN